MGAKIAAFWNNLPHPVQACLILFGGGVIGVVEPVIQDWASGKSVCTAGVAISICARGYAISALKAGIMAVLGLYVKSSFYNKNHS